MSEDTPGDEITDLDPDVARGFVEPSAEAFRRLVAVMAKLRRDCPWDREQNHQTLARHLLEETYETLEAIDQGDMDGLREELGDLVLQVVFHSNIAFEGGAFTVADVLDGLRQKLIRRHPHVFGDLEVSGPDEVKSNWERIKREEKRTELYEGIPKALPALARAAKLERRTADIRFAPGWENTETILEALAEEIEELRHELERHDGNAERVEAELGDVLFVTVALANRLGVDPEGALRRMLERSEARFRSVERMAAAAGNRVESLSPDERQRYWDHAKQENP